MARSKTIESEILDAIIEAASTMRANNTEPKAILCGYEVFMCLKRTDVYLSKFGEPAIVFGIPVEFKPEMPDWQFVVTSKTFDDKVRDFTPPKHKHLRTLKLKRFKENRNDT